MYRITISKVHFRWFTKNSFRKSKVSEFGLNHVADKFMDQLRTFASLNGFGSARSVQVQIINALCLGDKSQASNLLADLCCKKHSLRADDFVCILKYCARSPDPLFVLETWRVMKEKEIEMNGKCYFFIIQALCKGGYLKEAFSLMGIVRENPDIYPILPVYNIVLGACVRLHSVNYANECLDLMEHQMVGKNEVTYAELLKLAVLQGNLPAVHEIWKEFTKYYSLSIISLQKFIWSFTTLRDLESAYATLQHMVALFSQRDFFMTRTAEGKLCNARLDIPIPSHSDGGLKLCIMENAASPHPVIGSCKKMDICTRDSEHPTAFDMGRKQVRSVGINMLKKQINVPVIKILRRSFNDVLHACAHRRNCSLAEQLILQMQNLGLEPSCSTYDGFIKVVVSTRGFDDGIQLLKEMQQRNMKPSDSTLATISISCSRGLELDLAEAFLDQISKISSVSTCNALLEACDTLDQPERAVRILDKMKQLKLQPDNRTYELLFSLFGNVNAPYEEGNMLSQVDAAKRINAIEMDMMKNGIQHSHLSMMNVLKALGTEGMIRELIQYLRVAENLLSCGDSSLRTPIYNTVLHSLVEAKESHMAIEIFKTMKLFGIPLDAVTYDIMIDCCSISGCFKSACALVSVMIRGGFNTQAVTYTTLIKILLRDDNFDGALNLLDQGSSEGIQPDVLLFNTILRAACQKGRIDIIELIVEQMHQEKIHPDPSTCSHVFWAYLNHSFFSTAMEALQVLSLRMISEEDATLEEKRIQFEDLILAEDSEAESRILELFEDSKENLAVALLSLRWCATVGFTISWFPDQSQWAKRLRTSYGSRKSVG